MQVSLKFCEFNSVNITGLNLTKERKHLTQKRLEMKTLCKKRLYNQRELQSYYTWLRINLS